MIDWYKTMSRTALKTAQAEPARGERDGR